MNLSKETKDMIGEWLGRLMYKNEETGIKGTSFDTWGKGLSLGYEEAGTVLALYYNDIFDAWDYEVRLMGKIDNLKSLLTYRPIDNEALLITRAKIMALRTVLNYIVTMEKIGGMKV